MPSRNLNVIIIVAAVSLLCYFTHRRARPAMLVGDALNMINAFYVDPVDDDELLIAAMNGMTGTLDEHSEYIPDEAYENFQDSIQQEFAGIGIYVEQPEIDKPVRVITPLVGSPALEAGMMPGDEIVEIDSEDVSTMALRDVSTRLRGPIDTIVELRVRRGEEELPISVKRGRIDLESVVGDYRDIENNWVYRLRAEPTIAYMRLTSFGEKTTDEVTEVLSALDNDFEALIFDLRGNGGGLLHTAAAIADMFLDSGNIVSTRTRGGVIEDRFDAEVGTLVDSGKPIAILIDGNSASASEIVAAALKDNGRAMIVGTRSYGKGTVQNILPLQYGRSALRLTVARYYRPNGKNIHRLKDAKEEDEWGVSPDEGMEIELDEASLEKISTRWREAAYPALALVASPDLIESGEKINDGAGSDVENKVDESDGDDGEDVVSSGTMIDPQLRRAVEALRTKIKSKQPSTEAA